jgi:hypothetical protein
MNLLEIIRRSRQLSALKGHMILARGKRDGGRARALSAPPRVVLNKNKPLIAQPRESAMLICGQFGLK